jgi:hydrogenase/urease accessory protein HupE
VTTSAGRAQPASSRRNAKRAALIAIGVFAIEWLATSASAHALAPALLDLTEDASGRVEVLWKQSVLSAPGREVRPILPPDCALLDGPRSEKEGSAVLVRWTLDCGAVGLIGQPLRVDGLGAAKIDTLVRIELADGRRIQSVLRGVEPSMRVPARVTRWAVFMDYLTIGFEHILSGADHLLFVFGLFLLCSAVSPLIKTITAFTLGHSLTLSLAALGYTNLPSGPIEILIAASVLALAVELARNEGKATLMRRHPWPIALLFGLLHGMGFAGALREVGLPDGEIPIALFSFNVGIELGQLLFVAALLALTPLVRRIEIRLPRYWPRRVAVYVMGSLAAYWLFERSALVI